MLNKHTHYFWECKLNYGKQTYTLLFGNVYTYILLFGECKLNYGKQRYTLLLEDVI